MLLKFKTSNFGSISDLQEFSMLCGSTRSRPDHIHEIGNVRILKNTVMYGANAAGKSAFVRAIQTSQEIVLNSIDLILNIEKKYCRVDSENNRRPSYFEYIISIGNRFFSYGFEATLSSMRLNSEWLIELSGDLSEKTVIFQRDSESKKQFEFGEDFSEDTLSRLMIYASDMKGKITKTFLSEMSSKNMEDDESLKIFREIYDWFDKKLLVNIVKMPDKKSLFSSGRIMKMLDTGISNITSNLISRKELNTYDPVMLNYVGNYLRENDEKGKQGVYIDHRNWVLFEMASDGIRASKVMTTHGGDGRYDIEEESTGTRDILRMITLLTDAEDDITYIQDEFGNSFHPELSYRFMELIQEHNLNSSRQFIVTTHEVKLMTMDLFRRDEIWFVEKKEGKSIIYSLEEFKERFDKSLYKAYLEGRYGALPVFGEMDEE